MPVLVYGMRKSIFLILERSLRKFLRELLNMAIKLGNQACKSFNNGKYYTTFSSDFINESVLVISSHVSIFSSPC